MEEGREHRFTQGSSTTKMMRMKDTKMKKRLKSSSKSWTPATETFLWQVLFLPFLVCYTTNAELPQMTIGSSEKAFRRRVVDEVRQWGRAEGVAHHFCHLNLSLTSILKINSLERQQRGVWLEHIWWGTATMLVTSRLTKHKNRQEEDFRDQLLLLESSPQGGIGTCWTPTGDHKNKPKASAPLL